MREQRNCVQEIIERKKDDRFHLGVIESKIKEGRGREAQNIDEVQR
jgi:hypothetical protein